MSTFRRLMKPHAPPEKRMSVETNGASGDVPAAVGKKKNNKKIANYRNAPHPQACVLSFSRDKMVNALFNEILKK